MDRHTGGCDSAWDQRSPAVLYRLCAGYSPYVGIGQRESTAAGVPGLRAGRCRLQGEGCGGQRRGGNAVAALGRVEIDRQSDVRACRVVIGVETSEAAFEIGGGVGQRCPRFRPTRLDNIRAVAWIGYRGKNADNHDNDHELYQRESFLTFVHTASHHEWLSVHGGRLHGGAIKSA